MARTKSSPRRRPTGVQLGEGMARPMILQGGARTFEKMGLRATSVEDLLVASNVSRRTFYRNYKSKEDVALELYDLGTNLLLDACRRAVKEESDPLKQFERCIDAHLSTLQSFGRLVFVLGGEAARAESPLYVRRMQVHDELVALFGESLLAHLGRRVDPFLVRSLVLTMEAVPRMLFAEGDEGRSVTAEGIDRARSVMKRVLSAVLEGTGPRVAPIPTAG